MVLRYDVKGLDCAHCAANLESEIAEIEGVISASVSFMTLKIEVEFEDDKKDIVIDEIKTQLEKLSNISQTELNKAKKRAKVNFAQESEMVSDIADAIGYWMTVVEDVAMANKYLAVLDEIDCEYLQDIAKKYLAPEKLSISLLLPKGEK